MKINGLYPGELQPDETVGGCIDIFENVWKMPERTIEQVEHACADSESGVYWQKAETIGAGAMQKMRTNDMCSISHLAEVTGHALMQNIHNQFYVSLLAASIPYAERYELQEEMFHEPYSLLRYGETQEYKCHYDGYTGIGRVISALCYLNDDYEGGELEFPNFGVKIKPQAGMMILFPSNFAYSHIAHPVSQGTKYTMVTWIKDRAV